MPVVMCEGQRPLLLRGRKVEYRFLPGPNDVTDADWKSLMDEKDGSETLRFFIRNRTLSVLHSKSEDGRQRPVKDLNSIDITQMDPYSAVELVKTIVDPAMLQKMQAQELDNDGGRADVLDALEAQMEAMGATPVDEEPTTDQPTADNAEANAGSQMRQAIRKLTGRKGGRQTPKRV